MNLSELKGEDYQQLQWHISLLVVCVLLVGGAFFIVSSMTGEANNRLNRARLEVQREQTALELIEQEEATIVDNIERYKNIEAEGVVAPKDILYIQERAKAIKDVEHLYSFDLNYIPLRSRSLQYDTSIYQAGAPVDLEVSQLDLNLPLLHEDDLIHFMDELLATDGLFLPLRCTLSNRTRSRAQLNRLAQHMQASCSLLWLSFTVHEAED